MSNVQTITKLHFLSRNSKEKQCWCWNETKLMLFNVALLQTVTSVMCRNEYVYLGNEVHRTQWRIFYKTNSFENKDCLVGQLFSCLYCLHRFIKFWWVETCKNVQVKKHMHKICLHPICICLYQNKMNIVFLFSKRAICFNQQTNFVPSNRNILCWTL